MQNIFIISFLQKEAIISFFLLAASLIDQFGFFIFRKALHLSPSLWNVTEKIEDRRMKETLLELIDSCTGELPIGDCPILGAIEGESKTEENLR